jgi:hypothetical protein
VLGENRYNTMNRPKPDIHVVYEGHFDQCRSSGMFGGATVYFCML